MCFVFLVGVLKARKVFVPGRIDFKQLSFTRQEAQYLRECNGMERVL